MYDKSCFSLFHDWTHAALNLDLKSGALLGESKERLPVEIQKSISDDLRFLFHKGQPRPTSSGSNQDLYRCLS